VIQTTGGDLQMHVHGTMYGGLQDRSTDPDTLDAVLRGQAEIDFWYRDHVATGDGGVGGDDAAGALYTVTDDSHSIVDPMGNTGTIAWIVGGTTTTYFLQDQAGSHFSARLATDHRTPSSPDTLSFWGWVNHSTVQNATLASGTADSPDYQHFYSSDWLLTAELMAVPVPAAAWMGLSMLGGLGVVGKLRKNRQQG
jgi:hypothetical protein